MLKQMKPDLSSSHAKKRHKDQTSLKFKEKRAENVRRIACRYNRFISMWFRNLWRNENDAILRRENRPTSRSDNMREMNDSLMTAGLRRGAKFGLKDFWNEVNICSVKDQLRAYGGFDFFMQTWFLKPETEYFVIHSNENLNPIRALAKVWTTLF